MSQIIFKVYLPVKNEEIDLKNTIYSIIRHKLLC